MTFSLRALEFAFAGDEASIVRSPKAINILRGTLGAELHACEASYRRWFTPIWPSGPSGYREAPRPFVLRRGLSFSRAAFQLVVFPIAWPLEELKQAMLAALVRFTRGPIETSEPDRLSFTLARACQPATQSGPLRIVFDTPTELKHHGAVIERPEFSALIDRLIERVWLLGRLYNEWPAETGLGYLAELSRSVELTDYEWKRVGQQRRSARSGTIHSIGGFVGWAEYRGPVAPFLPLLAIGAWTGVGRQTVWGKGVFHVDAAKTPILRPA